MSRLLLVDGSNYFYRAHYAMAELKNSQGMYIGALYGMISMLRRLRQEFPSEYIACIFDAKGPTFRHHIFPDYKGTRSEMPQELISQMHIMPKLVQALGWQTLSIEGLEADDIIGTLSKNAANNGLQVLIATADKDMAQLVNTQVHMVDTMKNLYIDIEGVIGKFGVEPQQMIDYLTLMGDQSDNIPGVSKVGPKTAAKWLAEYKTLDKILEVQDSIKGVVGENLRQASTWLPVTKKLITIHQDCEDFIDDVLPQWQNWRCFQALPENNIELRDLFIQLEFKSWLHELYKKHPELKQTSQTLQTSEMLKTSENSENSENLEEQQTSENLNNNENNENNENNINNQNQLEQKYNHQYQRVIEFTDFTEFLNILNKKSKNNLENDSETFIAIDTETNGLNTQKADLIGISLAIISADDQILAVYIPIQHGEYQANIAVIDAVKNILADENISKIAQNLKYDLHIFERHGFVLKGELHDTMLASYILNSQENHNLDALIQNHLPQYIGQTTSYQEVSDNGKLTFDQINIEKASHYAAEDAAMTLELFTVLKNKLIKNQKLYDLYQKIEMPLVPILKNIEASGIRLDVNFLQEESKFLEQELAKIEQIITDIAGETFNLYSPKQIAHVLYEKLGLPILKKTAQKAPSTDEEVLSKLAKDHPIAQALLQHRGLAKLKNTYVDKLPTLVDATERVHTQFMQHVTSTGRLSSTEPNLQNIPIKTEQGRRVRRAFIAKAGHCIVGLDYSQIELRLLAHFSKDAQLLQAFQNQQDIHQATAASIFHGDIHALEKVTTEQRRYAKSINFGLIYGMSAFGLATQLNIEVGMAQRYIDQYFAQYPSILNYMEELKAFAKSHSYVETLLGRQIHIPQIHAKQYTVRQAAERLAINAPMQGSAADLIKIAMQTMIQHIQTEQLATKMVLQVHDELLFEVPYEELEHVQANFQKLMESAYVLDVPLVANLSIGENWDEAH